MTNAVSLLDSGIQGDWVRHKQDEFSPVLLWLISNSGKIHRYIPKTHIKMPNEGNKIVSKNEIFLKVEIKRLDGKHRSKHLSKGNKK